MPFRDDFRKISGFSMFDKGYGINIPADPFRNSGLAGAAADFGGSQSET
jgi:hypothetical protein